MNSRRLEIIDIANEYFGELGWSFSISNVALDYVDQSGSSHYSVGTSAVIRVQRSNGTFREDVGYGFADGPIKSDVICKAKKDAVTDGLRGAVLSFGGDVAKKISSMSPDRVMSENLELCAHAQENIPILLSSPYQDTAKQYSATKCGDGQQKTVGTLDQGKVPAASTSPVVMSKHSSTSSLVTSIPKISPPLAIPLPQATISGGSLSEEELAKIERKKRQKQLQEEFRKKHHLEQAQSIVQGKQMPTEESKVPFKEEKTTNQPQAKTSDIVGDEEVLLSTQDIEAMVLMAANNTSVSRRVPILSSPSIAKSTPSECMAQIAPQKNVAGQKRTYLSNFAFRAEKKSRCTDL